MPELSKGQLEAYVPRVLMHVAGFGRKNMKVVLLAGGLGTRIMEGSDKKPKPMLEIVGMLILWPS